MKTGFIKSILVAVLALLTASSSLAETPELGIVSRTDCGIFWRYNFNYTTTDVDGVTPITLSGAIFLSSEVHERRTVAKGLGLLNHYTITANRQRPSNVTAFATLEGFISNTNYILIESDGFGFGIDSLRNQKYLQGRATARVNIDAFIAGRKLIEQEGYSHGDVILNLGYSQGGHSGMWVNRLIAEGYRNDELPRINYCLLGGGPYDMYSHYNKLLTEDKTQYPVALPLILSGMIDAGGYKVKYEDVFTDEVQEALPELFDTKLHDTEYINEFFYENFGGSKEDGLEMSKIVKDVFFDPESEAMSDIVYHLKENSLVYDSWSPDKTDSMTFVHSPADEVVPYLNMASMEKYLQSVGYNAYDIDNTSTELHTSTGTRYAFKVAVSLAYYVPTGMEERFGNTPGECLHDIYSIDGRLIYRKAKMSEVYPALPKGIYVIKGRKVVKR
ncbi:MAG: hypothetical protein ACI4BA_05980 [Prevotella sp.]